MSIFERVKGQPSMPVVPSAAPAASPAPNAEKFVEGAAVKVLNGRVLGDAGPGVYRDRAGIKLGGGPSEGTAYMGEIARQAQLSVEAAELAELAALEREEERDAARRGTSQKKTA